MHTPPFSINKSTISFCIIKLTTEHLSKLQFLPIPQSPQVSPSPDVFICPPSKKSFRSSPRYINNNLSVYLSLNTEQSLDKSKSSNKRIKGTRKGTFISYSFLSQKKQTQQCTVGASVPYFKIHAPLFCCLLFTTPKSRSTKQQTNILSIITRVLQAYPKGYFLSHFYGSLSVLSISP